MPWRAAAHHSRSGHGRSRLGERRRPPAVTYNVATVTGGFTRQLSPPRLGRPTWLSQSFVGVTEFGASASRTIPRCPQQCPTPPLPHTGPAPPTPTGQPPIADSDRPAADCRLRPASRRLPTRTGQPPITDSDRPAADCRLEADAGRGDSTADQAAALPVVPIQGEYRPDVR